MEESEGPPKVLVVALIGAGVGCVIALVIFVLPSEEQRHRKFAVSVTETAPAKPVAAPAPESQTAPYPIDAPEETDDGGFVVNPPPEVVGSEPARPAVAVQKSSPAPFLALERKQPEPPPVAAKKPAPAAAPSELPPDDPPDSGRMFSSKTTDKLNAIWVRYRDKSPAVKELREGFHKDPHLKALIEKYYEDGDVWAWLKGGLASSNWRRLVVKAFASPDTAKMLIEMMRNTPPDALGKVGSEIKKNDLAGTLVKDMSSAAGVPLATMLPSQPMGDAELMQAAMQDPRYREALKHGVPAIKKER